MLFLKNEFSDFGLFARAPIDSPETYTDFRQSARENELHSNKAKSLETLSHQLTYSLLLQFSHDISLLRRAKSFQSFEASHHQESHDEDDEDCRAEGWIFPMLSLSKWSELCHKHFGWSHENAQVYFEVFSLLCHSLSSKTSSRALPTFNKDNNHKISSLKAILLLYNQLSPSAYLSDSQHVVFSSSNSSLSPLTSSPPKRAMMLTRGDHSRLSSVSASSVFTTTSSGPISSRAPPTIISSRYYHSRYWSESTSYWLYLIWVCIHGTASSMHSLEDMKFKLSDGVLNSVVSFLFIHGDSSNDESFGSRRIEEWKKWIESDVTKRGKKIFPINESLFESFYSGILEDLKSKEASDPENESQKSWTEVDAPCSRVLFDFIIESQVLGRNGRDLLNNPQGGMDFPLSIIERWIRWSITDRPATFKKFKLSEHGVVYGIGQDSLVFNHKHDPILLTRKRNQVILVHPNQLHNKTLFIHRCHNCVIYLLGGPLSNLHISSCRSTRIVTGPINYFVHISDTRHVYLSTVCSSLVATTPSTSLTVCAYTHTRPLLLSQNQNHRISDIVLGPCEAWYEGMKNDMDIWWTKTMLPPNRCQEPWMEPRSVHGYYGSDWDETVGSDMRDVNLQWSWGILPVSGYFPFKVSFSASPSAPDETRQEETSAVSSLHPIEPPEAYRSWEVACREFRQATAEAIAIAVAAEDKSVSDYKYRTKGKSARPSRLGNVGLQKMIDLEFQGWMKKEDEYDDIKILLDASSDLERMAKDADRLNI